MERQADGCFDELSIPSQGENRIMARGGQMTWM